MRRSTEMDRQRLNKLTIRLPLLVALLFGVWLSSRWLSAWPGRGHADSISPQVVLPYAERDLGTIRQGAVLSATFPIANAGTRRLILREEGAGCCGQSTRPPAIIVPPGGSTDLTLELDTRRYDGRLEHTVRYVTNDPRCPRIALHVSATCAVFSPDGKSLATTGRDGKINLRGTEDLLKHAHDAGSPEQVGSASGDGKCPCRSD